MQCTIYYCNIGKEKNIDNKINIISIERLMLNLITFFFQISTNIPFLFIKINYLNYKKSFKILFIFNQIKLY